MSSTSPAPNSAPDEVPPPSNTISPPSSSTNSTTPTPPPQSSPPPPQPSPPPPDIVTPPPQSPPPIVPTSPPPVTPSPPPPSTPSPPPPVDTPPPPLPTPSPPQPAVSPSSSPPPPPSRNPPSSPPPPKPPSSSPPEDPSPPPPASPESSPPPPQSDPPKSSAQPPPESPSGASPPPPSQSNSQPISSPPSLVSPPSSTPVTPSGDPSADNSSPTPPASSNSKGNGNTGAVAIGVVAGFVVLGLIAFGVWYWCMRKQRKQSQLNGAYIMPSPVGSPARSELLPIATTYSSAPLMGPGSRSSDLIYTSTEAGGHELGNSRPLFTYEDLLKATNGFSAQNLLGEGGFGAVYKGHLPDERVVAVKQLKVGGGQGEREFKAEVETISRIHHRHLVSLLGYCISKDQRLLVYEYVSNNTLYFHLHGKDRPVLDWATRAKVAAGAARGIAYLHEDCHPRIIHRDIKSSNILLDDNFEARVSDFGLAKLAPDVYTHITTRVMGTFGYMAPEYASSGKLTEKSDVYSFGVVLLELITGRKPVDATQALGDESLVLRARPLLTQALDNENFEGLVDPRLEGNYVESEMFRMIEAAAACVRHFAAKRPRMVQIARAFDNTNSSDLTNGMKPGQSEAFNAAQQSEEIRFFRRMAFGSQNYDSGFFSQSTSGSDV